MPRPSSAIFARPTPFPRKAPLRINKKNLYLDCHNIPNHVTFMRNLTSLGRIFYGISIAALGFLTIYFKDFPYFLIPARHPWLISHAIFIYISGALLILAGACVVIEKKVLPASL